MNKKVNAHCKICGKGYYICNNCESSKLMTWRSIVDTVEHYKIYMILRDYSNNYMDKQAAKKQLQKLELSDLDMFLADIKSKILEIMSDDIS